MSENATEQKAEQGKQPAADEKPATFTQEEVDRMVGRARGEAKRSAATELAEQLGCWLLFTWADGALEIEEDFPPYALVPELLAGTFTDPDRRTIYEVRWIREDRIEDHWGRYGVHHPAGHYMAIAARQRRGHR